MPKFLPKDRLRWATLIRRDRRFKPTEHSIAMEIANRANEEGYTWVGKKRLASDLGLSQRTVQRGLSKYKALGYLRAKARPGFTSFHHLCFPETPGDSHDQEVGHPCPDSQDARVSQTYIEPLNEPNTVLDRKASDRHTSPAICELELAYRIGYDGYEILEKLKPWHVAKLIGKFKDGTLTADDIADARIAGWETECEN